MLPPWSCTRYADVEDFLAAAGDFLVAREAEHNLLLGVCQTVRDTPDAYTAPPYFATVSDGGRVVAVALQTPPFQLVISEVDDPAAIPLSRRRPRRVATCRARVGPVEHVRAFMRRADGPRRTAGTSRPPRSGSFG